MVKLGNTHLKKIQADPSKIACWASAGYNAAGCMAIENQLRQCMDGPPAPAPKPNTINYHLSRMQRYVTAQPKHGRRL